jgi:hypothetical protein
VSKINEEEQPPPLKAHINSPSPLPSPPRGEEIAWVTSPPLPSPPRGEGIAWVTSPPLPSPPKGRGDMLGNFSPKFLTLTQILDS